MVKNGMNFALGAAIKKDKMRFREPAVSQLTAVPGFYGKRLPAIPRVGTVEIAAPSRTATTEDQRDPTTAQLTPRNKVTFYEDYQKNCTGNSFSPDGKQCRNPGDGWTALNGGFNSGAPESGNVWDDREKVIQASWSSPVTSRLLLEAGASSFNSRWGGQEPAGALMNFIPVVELIPGAPGSGGVPVGFYAYRAPWGFFGNTFGNDQQHNVWRASTT
jgi:hypothetical protein